MTKKLYLKDMTHEQLEQIYYNCYDEIRSKIEYILMDDGNTSIRECLEDAPENSSCEIDAYNGVALHLYNHREYIHASDIWNTIKWLEKNDIMRCILDENEYDNILEDLEKTVKYQEVIDNEDCGAINVKYEDYKYMEKYVSDHIENIEEKLSYALEKEYKYYLEDDDYALSLFTDEYGLSLFENYYVYEGVNILFEEVSYTREIHMSGCITAA